MIQILPDKLIIEIKTDYPLDDACYMKLAIINAIEDIAWHGTEDSEFGKRVNYLHHLAKLAQEMEYDPETLHEAFGLTNAGKYDKKYSKTDKFQTEINYLDEKKKNLESWLRVEKAYE